MRRIRVLMHIWPRESNAACLFLFSSVMKATYLGSSLGPVSDFESCHYAYQRQYFAHGDAIKSLAWVDENMEA